MTNLYKEINDNLQEPLLEMARIGFTNDSYEVYVNTDDPGDIPHFHYRKKGTWEGHTCIRLDKPEYFQHGDKQATLNSKQKKELVNFLKSKPLKAKRFDTNWEYLINEWNANNSNIEIAEDTKMPDYNKLSTSKDKVGAF